MANRQGPARSAAAGEVGSWSSHAKLPPRHTSVSALTALPVLSQHARWRSGESAWVLDDLYTGGCVISGACYSRNAGCRNPYLACDLTLEAGIPVDMISNLVGRHLVCPVLRWFM